MIQTKQTCINMGEIINVLPGFTNEAHPEVFNIEAMRPQCKEKKAGQLPDSLIREFFEQGFIVVKYFFKPEELEPAKRKMEKLVDNLAGKAGKIKSLHEDSDNFSERLTMLEKEFRGATMLIIKSGSMTAKGLQDLWSHERLLNVIEQLIGPDIVGSPSWTIRPKIPQNKATEVPWHQDNGYFDNDMYKVLMPTAWIPLINATEQNGCMQFAVKGHKTGVVGEHKCCWRNTLYIWIEEEEMKNRLGIDMEKDIKVCEVPFGGLILFNNMIPHRSVPNISHEIRWSLDFRWVKASDPLGVYGVKEGIRMRSSENPSLNIDWEGFNRNDRRGAMRRALNLKEEAEFDITMPGPQMRKWKVVNHNEHTNRFVEAGLNL